MEFCGTSLNVRARVIRAVMELFEFSYFFKSAVDAVFPYIANMKSAVDAHTSTVDIYR